MEPLSPLQNFYLVSDAQLDSLVERVVKKILESRKPRTQDLPDKLFIKEACSITGLSKSSIYGKSHFGEIPCQKFGKRLVFSRKALNSWMTELTVQKKSQKDAAIFHLQKEAHRKTG